MSDPTARTFSSDFKRFFVRGLVILLPTVLTLWIVVKAYQFVDNAIADPINRSVRVAMNNIAPHWSALSAFEPADSQVNATIAERATSRGLVKRDTVRAELRAGGVIDPTDDQLNTAIADRAANQNLIYPASVRAELRQKSIDEWWAERWYMELIGLIVAIIAVYIVGRLLGGFLGKSLYKQIERFITSLPVFKQVYPYVKQIVDFLFGDEKQIKFNRVVVVEYPRKGIWSVGFQTGGTMQTIQEQAGESVTIFIPSSPTPFTGYTITIPKREVIELPITVEEAIRFCVSGGVLVPDHQLVPEESPTLRPLPGAESIFAKTANGPTSGDPHSGPTRPVQHSSADRE